jgi:hypothetical protein
MPVSGLVVTLDMAGGCGVVAVREMHRAGPFTFGYVSGNRVTVALEADTPAEAEDWHRWLAGLPGVLKVDVAVVHLEPAAEEPAHAR